MEDYKKSKKIVWIITVTIILILGIVGYIIYDNFLKVDKTAPNYDSSNTTTTTTTNAVEEESNKKEKITYITLKENESLEEKDYMKDDYDSDKYIISFKEIKIELDFNGEYGEYFVTVKLNDLEIGTFLQYEGRSLLEIQNYKKYIFIYTGCHCDAPGAYNEKAINIETKKLFDVDCFPNENGVCEYQKYENIIENQYNDTTYTIDYTNDAKKTINKQEKFNCDNYMNDYNIHDNEDLVNLIEKDCNKDKKCIDRTHFCNDYGY